MKKLDKKQVPQFIALCVLTAGVSGYLVVHLVAPGPVSAGTRGPAAPVPAAGQVLAGKPDAGAALPAGGSAVDGTVPDADPSDAPPPSPTMHDPFAVGYVDPASLPAGSAAALPAPMLPKMPSAAKAASTSLLGPMPVAFPGAPALPGRISGFPGVLPSAQPAGSMAIGPVASAPAAPALPSAPPAPVWTVTGVLQGATGKVAILRSGESRRIVRSGDFVDSTYRVAGVTRTAVILRHGTTFYHLVLGAVQTAPTGPSTARPAALPAAPSLPMPAPRSAALIDDTIIPVYHTARTKSLLTHLKRQGADMSLIAGSVSVPKPTHTAAAVKRVSPAKVASAISLGLRLLDGSVLAQNRK